MRFHCGRGYQVKCKQKSKQKYIFLSVLLVKVVEKTAVGYKIS